MSRPQRVAIVLNPASAAGRTGALASAIVEAARSYAASVVLLRTEGPGHGMALATQAVADGADLVIAAGGDGTANEVVNGLLTAQEAGLPLATFALLPAGTGGDLVRTLRVPRDHAAAMAAIWGAPTRRIDVMRLSFVDHQGAQARRWCVNVAGIGMNGDVVERTNRRSKRLGGRVTFLLATLESLLRYRPGPVRLRWMDTAGQAGSWEGTLSSAFLANGGWCGGGMWVGRGGAIDDGQIDLTVLPELPLFQALIAAPRLFSGSLERVKGVSRVGVRWLEAETLDRAAVRIDCDGEQPGVLPLRADICEKVLPVRAFF
jgi:diacylglycerol kinase (ATP)